MLHEGGFTMKRLGVMGVFGLALLLGGCQGAGEMVNLNLHSLQSPPPAQPEPLKIAVHPFEDLRSTPDRIGLRTHLGGGATYFTAWDGDIEHGMARIAVQYFRQQGWDAELADPKSPPADVTLIGKIKEFSARAKSRFGSTALEVHVLIQFEAHNKRDRSIERITLGAKGSDTSVFFDPHDLEELTNDVLKDTFMQFMKNTHVKRGALKIKG